MSRVALHVLLVDDNASGVEFLEMRLRALGHRTSFAPNGAVAVSSIERDRPDVIVLDVTMPEMNGYQACRAIKRIDSKIPILILTAKNEPADRFWAQQSGADEFMNKPADPARVVEVVLELAARAAR